MKRNAGFTLIELVVAVAVFAIFFIGILNMLDSSSKVSREQSALADVQENVRYATYHIMRTARMIGASSMPIARSAPSVAWVAADIRNNSSGTETIVPFGSITVQAGSDVVTLRGLFEHSPFPVQRYDVNLGTGTIVIRESVGTRQINDFTGLPASDAFSGRGLLLMGMGELGDTSYRVVEVLGGAAMAGTAPNRTLTLNFVSGNAPWEALNPGGSYIVPTFEVYRIGILESYTYYVDPEFTLMRRRVATGASGEPVAVQIGNLQVAVGLDTTGDGAIDTWDTTLGVVAAATRARAMRISVLGRTGFQLPGWKQPASTFNVEDLPVATVDSSAKWRTMQVTATLRNYIL
jgi:prepilin-type N-terminal cleavage/methylation domain-containing protein